MNHKISTIALLLIITIIGVVLVIEAEFESFRGWTYEEDNKVVFNPWYFERYNDDHYIEWDNGVLQYYNGTICDMNGCIGTGSSYFTNITVTDTINASRMCSPNDLSCICHNGTHWKLGGTC